MLTIFVITIIIIINSVNTQIAKSLLEYIETKNRIEKYSVTTSVDYKNNHSSFVEENLFLNTKNAISFKDILVLKDRILNVSVFQRENHEFDCKISYDNQNKTVVNGYSIEILNFLQDILRFKIHYYVIERFQNSDNVTIELALLNNNTIDLIVCHPETNNTLTEVLHPTLKSSYVLIYKPSKLSFTEDIFILTFAGTLWLCFIIVLILLAISLRIVTKQYKQMYGYSEWGTVEITFWAIATACQQGLSTTPYGFATRLIIVLGAMTAYLLYTGFAAGITSLVAVQNKNFEITIADIEHMKLKVISFGNLVDIPLKYNYLRTSWAVSNLDTLFTQLNEKNWIGVTLQVFLDQYLKTHKTFDHCSHTMSVITDSEHAMSNLVPKKSELKKVFNYWLLKAEEPGVSPSRQTKRKLIYSECNTLGGYTSAKLEHVRSAIAVLLVGLVVSFVFMLGECIWFGYLHRKERRRHQK